MFSLRKYPMPMAGAAVVVIVCQMVRRPAASTMKICFAAHDDELLDCVLHYYSSSCRSIFLSLNSMNY
jgi:hypothetical protein